MTLDTRDRPRPLVRLSLGLVASVALGLGPHNAHAASADGTSDADGVELLDNALDALEDNDLDTYNGLVEQAFNGAVWLPSAAIIALDDEDPDDLALWFTVLDGDDIDLIAFASIAITWERDAWNDLAPGAQSTPEQSLEITYADEDAASVLEVIDRRDIQIPDSARLVLSRAAVNGDLPDDDVYVQALSDLTGFVPTESPAEAIDQTPETSAPDVVTEEVVTDEAATTTPAPAETAQPANTVAVPTQTPVNTSSSVPLIIAIALGAAALLLGIVGAFRTRKTDQLADIAFTDGLTGLNNRRRLDADVAAQRARGERTTATLMVDVDHFKQFNDTHGHALGDEVLRLVGDVLDKEFRRTDVPYRYGGEEFCVLLQDSTAQEARAAGERARAAIAAIELPVDATVTASVGVSTGSAAMVERTIERADAALYDAKEAGRNCVVMH